LRKSYLGPGFTYTGAPEPVALSGRDRNVATGAAVALDGSESFSESGRPLSWTWTLASKPAGELSEADSPAPSFRPDIAGLYVARLVVFDVSDASVQSRPSTVSITAIPADRAGVR
jgi:hypothetical protein